MISEVKTTYPLTHPQLRIWYNENIYQGTSMNTIGGTANIAGIIDFYALEKSINHFIYRHEGIRAQLVGTDVQVKQYIQEYEYQAIDFYDFSDSGHPMQQFDEWVDVQSKELFCLFESPLYYFAIFKISNHFCGFLAKFHHIIADGWSMKIIVDEVIKGYNSILSGYPLEEKSYRFSDYIELESTYLRSRRSQKNKLYWRNKLYSIQQPSLLPRSGSTSGRRAVHTFDPAFSDELRAFSMEHGVTVAELFLSVFLLSLCYQVENNEAAVGIPLLSRTGKKERSMFGMLTSTVPFFVQLNPGESFAHYLNRIKKELYSCYLNHRYPYDLLIKDVDSAGMNISELINVSFNYYNTKFDAAIDGKELEVVEFYNGHQFYSLQLIVKEWSSTGSIELNFDYKQQDYTDASIRTLTQIMDDVMCKIAKGHFNINESAGSIVGAEPIHSRDHKEVWNNNGVAHSTVIERFEYQVSRVPTNIAIIDNGFNLTYEDLNRKVNRLASELTRRQIGKSDIVGIFTSHSIETIVGILAVLKSGAAFLPIDPKFPYERIEQILRDADVKLVLTNLDNNRLNILDIQFLDLRNDQLLQGGSDAYIMQAHHSNELAYVIYTSGSTGKPKGVMIENHSLLNYVMWAINSYGMKEEDCFAFYSSLAFDLTITSIFVPLLSGGSMAIYSAPVEDHVLNEMIKQQKVTVIKLTPSHLKLLNEYGWESSDGLRLRSLIVGGENLATNLSKSIYDKYEGKVQIFNEYGPTEATVGCMIYEFKPEETRRFVPIGAPIDNVEIHVLKDGYKPAKLYETGEIYISGVALARGYLNNKALTSQRFVDSPFSSGEKMYKTGDIGKILSSGIIGYEGRIDRQVKRRGYRIELSEIEAVLLEHPSVLDGAVDLKSIDRNDFLCAFVVLKDKAENAKIINDYLASYLPTFMMPDYIIALPVLPLTGNGKIDLTKLPLPILNESTGKNCNDGIRSEFEEVLIKAISEVLQKNDVTVNDNYYHIGGDSINAITISWKLRSFGYELNVRDMLSFPYINQMAQKIKLVDESDYRKGADQLCEGNIPITPIVNWFLAQDLIEPGKYNQSVVLTLEHHIDRLELEEIFYQLISYHDSLRINFDPSRNILFYNNAHLKKVFTIDSLDIDPCFNLKEDLLVKVSELGEKKLRITIHHLVIDVISWEILLSDLSNMIHQKRRIQPFRLGMKTDSYRTWAEHCHSRPSQWEDSKFRDNERSEKFSIKATLPVNTIKPLIEKANRLLNLRTHELMAIVFTLSYMQRFGCNEMLLELETHGRELNNGPLNIERTVGWFSSFKEKYFSLSGATLKEEFTHLKEQYRTTNVEPLRQDHPHWNTLNRLRFNYIGELMTNYEEFHVRGMQDTFERNQSISNRDSCVLCVNAVGDNELLNVWITYDKRKVGDDRAADFLKNYLNDIEMIVNGIINACAETSFYTPSDFEFVDMLQDDLDTILNE